jgi:DNA-binding response OmpR family regulator
MTEKRVLIVDHYDATLDLLVELFKGEGYTALRSSGERLSAGCIGDARADLVILDLGLDDPSGVLPLLRDLRQRPNTWALPVIVNSTDEQLLEHLAEDLRELRCAALSKPFDLETLMALVRACLDPGRERSRGSAGERAF